MVRDLVKQSINMFQTRARGDVRTKAIEAAEERLLDALLPAPSAWSNSPAIDGSKDEAATGVGNDLLAQERPTPALDAIHGRVDLVSAVDREIEPAVDPVRDRDVCRFS